MGLLFSYPGLDRSQHPSDDFAECNWPIYEIIGHPFRAVARKKKRSANEEIRRRCASSYSLEKLFVQHRCAGAEGLVFLKEVSLAALSELIPVDLMGIEVRAVNAGKLGR